MVKGYKKNQQRQEALASFGKTLVRRSKSHCELCQTNTKLNVFEVAPVADEPEIEKCVLICGQCQQQLENPKKIEKEHWRCLQETVWSEVPAIQVVALRILKKLASSENWAVKILDDVYVEDDISSWADQEPL